MLLGCDSKEPAPVDGAASVQPRQESQQTLLTDVTAKAGIDFVHDAVREGDFFFPEINGAGCGFLDFDNDGFLDIYLVQSGRSLKNSAGPGNSIRTAKTNRLYHNQQDGTFADVTEKSGAGDEGYGQGMACGDYNNDGHVDIYIANVGGPSALLRNNGDGTFTNVAQQAGVTNGNWAITPAFLDYDNDGFLDIFASNYVQWSAEGNIVGHTKTGQPDYTGPRSFSAMSSILYHNNGDGTFTDRTEAAGIGTAFGAAMGILCADFNNDSLVDIYVANDSWANQLWLNQGDGTFQDRGLERACALSGTGIGLASMGTNAEDLNGDGKLDLFTTNYHGQGAILYLQGNNGIFNDASMRSQLFGPTAAMTGFGACFFDLFNDGSACVYIGNGAAVMGGELQSRDDASESGDSYAQRDTVLQWSEPASRFLDITDRIGSAMHPIYATRGVAVGDYDNDGGVDVLIANNNGPARLLRNMAAEHNWLQVRCLDASGKRDVIGAKIFVTVAGKTKRRDVIVNYSYASSSDPRIHFGLGQHSVVERIVVQWPGGGETIRESVPANQVVTVRQP